MDRPILFSGQMVRALLDGRKTMTRRIIKPQPVVHPAGNWSWEGRNGGFVGAAGTHLDEGFPESARHWVRIQPGDRLWVREAFSYETLDVDRNGFMPPWYWADGDPDSGDFTRPKPSIHMPRWASRLTLTVTDVRVQRLQDISREDAVAEGLIKLPASGRWVIEKGDQYFGAAHHDPRAVYEILWEQINGTGSWASNPWCAAYTFSVERRNIDEVAGKLADATPKSSPAEASHDR